MDERNDQNRRKLANAGEPCSSGRSAGFEGERDRFAVMIVAMVRDMAVFVRMFADRGCARAMFVRVRIGLSQRQNRRQTREEAAEP